MKYGVCLETKYKGLMLAAAGEYEQLVIDAADYTAAEIKRLKAGGKTKVLSYINVGAIETDRSYFSAAKQAASCTVNTITGQESTGSGLTKKVGEIAILVIGELFSYGMRIPPIIMDGISAYIIFMEFMSIMENLKKMGVPIPGFISKVLNTVDLALKEEEVTEALKKMAEIEKEVDALKRIQQREQ